MPPTDTTALNGTAARLDALHEDAQQLRTQLTRFEDRFIGWTEGHASAHVTIANMQNQEIREIRERMAKAETTLSFRTNLMAGWNAALTLAAAALGITKGGN